MHHWHDRGSLAARCSHPLHRAGPDVADGEDPGCGGGETLGRQLGVPQILGNVAPGQVEPLSVECHLRGQPLRARLRAAGIGHFAYVAASDEHALLFEQLQGELGEGPCLVAYSTDRPVAIPDLRDDHAFPEFSARAVADGLIAVFTFPLRHGNERLGALDLYRLTPGPLDGDATVAGQILADVAAVHLLNARSRSELRESSDHAQHLAIHGSLTRLPNRALLIERLEHAIARCNRSAKPVAIFYADLERFKAVNDTYGHQMGDELLIAAAHRPTHLLRPGDTVERLSGHEFVILCEDLEDASQAGELAERIAQRSPSRSGCGPPRSAT